MERRRGWKPLLAGILCSWMACSQIPLDNSVSASEGHAFTLVLSGCNQKAKSRYLFCEVRESAKPSVDITLHLPQVTCAANSCIQVQFTRLDGSFGEAFSVPKGDMFLRVPLSKIIGTEDEMNMGHDGEYQAGVRIHFQGPDGTEYLQSMRGLIRINVLRSDYLPVACNDQMIAWYTPLYGTKKTGCHAQWTSKMRSAVCGECELN